MAPLDRPRTSLFHLPKPKAALVEQWHAEVAAEGVGSLSPAADCLHFLLQPLHLSAQRLQLLIDQLPDDSVVSGKVREATGLLIAAATWVYRQLDGKP